MWSGGFGACTPAPLPAAAALRPGLDTVLVCWQRFPPLQTALAHLAATQVLPSATKLQMLSYCPKPEGEESHWTPCKAAMEAGKPPIDSGQLLTIDTMPGLRRLWLPPRRLPPQVLEEPPPGMSASQASMMREDFCLEAAGRDEIFMAEALALP